MHTFSDERENNTERYAANVRVPGMVGSRAVGADRAAWASAEGPWGPWKGGVAWGAAVQVAGPS